MIFMILWHHEMGVFAEVSLVPKGAWWTHNVCADTWHGGTDSQHGGTGWWGSTRVMGGVVQRRGCCGAPWYWSGYGIDTADTGTDTADTDTAGTTTAHTVTAGTTTAHTVTVTAGTDTA